MHKNENRIEKRVSSKAAIRKLNFMMKTIAVSEKGVGEGLRR
jgi:hypothetical protein